MLSVQDIKISIYIVSAGSGISSQFSVLSLGPFLVSAAGRVQLAVRASDGLTGRCSSRLPAACFFFFRKRGRPPPSLFLSFPLFFLTASITLLRPASSNSQKKEPSKSIMSNPSAPAAQQGESATQWACEQSRASHRIIPSPPLPRCRSLSLSLLTMPCYITDHRRPGTKVDWTQDRRSYIHRSRGL